MAVRVSSDKRECRVHVSGDMDVTYVKEIVQDLSSLEKKVSMPDEIIKTGSGYEMVFRNRKSIKEYLCFDGFGTGEYSVLVDSLHEIFELGRRLKQDPYGFVFDISCIFYEEGFRNLSFVFTPGNETRTNNLCSDLLSIVSLYSGFETDSEEEKMMRNVMEKVRAWEEMKDPDNIDPDTDPYDFPVFFGKKEIPEKKGKMICFFGNKPFVKFFSSDHEGYVCRIGRDSSWADIVTLSSFSGRHHAEIIYEDNRFCLRELGSVNGTEIGGIKAERGKTIPLRWIQKVKTGVNEIIILVCVPGM